jgi:para-nitrobenzyl esterase
MNHTKNCLRGLVLLPVLLTIACTERPGDTSVGEAAESAANESVAAAPMADDGKALAGSAWQLLRINSMDDTVMTPDDPAKYTLQFQADGRVAVRADCNRGSGTWQAHGATLTFGPLAMTRAMCPPGSLYDTFVAQLGYVRSFVLQDGNLHLATEADGSIIDFAPYRE